MITAQIITQFFGDGLTTETAFRPAVADACPLQKWRDVTALASAEIMPAPNLYVIEAEMDTETLAQIEADPNFWILWSE